MASTAVAASSMAAAGAAGAPTLDQLKQCVAAMYGPNVSNDRRRAADDWLWQFTKRPEAWQIAHALLQSGGTERELFVAAMTLHNKICSDFNTLNAASCAGLRTTLVEHLAKRRESRLVLGRLARAVAALATQWREWKDVVKMTVQTFGASPDNYKIMIALLCEFAEESVSYRVRADRVARREFQDELTANGESVFSLILTLMPKVDRKMQEDLVRTASLWVQCCRIKVEVVVKTGIHSIGFGALAVPELFEEGITLINSLLERYHNPTQHWELVKIMIPEVMKLQPRYNKAVADEDCDEEKLLVRVFATMARSYIGLILGDQDIGQLTLVQLLLQCTASREPDVTELTFEFWHGLLGGLSNFRDKAKRAAKTALLQSCLVKLVQVLLDVMQFPEDFDDYTADKKWEFRHQYRRELELILFNTGSHLPKGAILEGIAAALRQHVPVFVSTSGAGKDRVGTWQAVEACLVAVYSIAGHVSRHEEKVMPGVVAFIKTMPANNAMWTTGLEVLSEYKGWVSKHPAEVLPLLSLAVEKLGVTELQFAAASAIRSICTSSAAQVGDHALKIFTHPHTAALPIKEATLVLEGLCAAVSALPFDKCAAAQVELVKPMATLLHQFLTQPATAAASEAAKLAAAGQALSVEKAGVEGVVQALLKLTTVIKHITPVPPSGKRTPSVTLLDQLWPTLEAVSTTFADQTRIVEKLTRLYKHTIKAFKDDAAVLVERMVKQCHTRFMARPHSSYLYILGLLVRKYGKRAGVYDVLAPIVRALALKVFEMLKDGLPKFTQHPDIVEDFFRMMNNALVEWPKAVLGWDVMSQSVAAAVVGLKIKHSEANKSVLAYLETVVDTGVPESSADAEHIELQPVVGKLLDPLAQALMDSMIDAVLGVLSKSRIDDEEGSIGAVLFSIRQLSPSVCRTLLTQSFTTRVPDAKLHPKAKQRYIDAMVQTGTMEQMFEILKELHYDAGE